MSKLKIYVAGPFTSNPMHGTRNACLAGTVLYKAGYLPLVPHTNIAWDMVAPMSSEDWYDYTMDLLISWHPDFILRLPGASPGSDREVAWAHGQGVPVFEGDAQAFVMMYGVEKPLTVSDNSIPSSTNWRVPLSWSTPIIKRRRSR